MNTRKLKLDPQVPKAGLLRIDLKRVKKPRYGNDFQALHPGRVFNHPRGLTITEDLIYDFSGTFFDCNPLYRNREFSEKVGHTKVPAPASLVFNVVLSLSVQNDSEQVLANLGYDDLCFLRPVFDGDTLYAKSQVLTRKQHGKTGRVRIRSLGYNQHGELVVSYDRDVLLWVSTSQSTKTPIETEKIITPSVEGMVYQVLTADDLPRCEVARGDAYFENFETGDIIVHANGRTISDEHYAWTSRLGNTHPVHFDRVYSNSSRHRGILRGEPLVYGGFIYAWLCGLASRDCTENALWEFGSTAVRHLQPVSSGDTIYAISRVLEKREIEGFPDAGLITFQLVGVKNISAEQALEDYNSDLFGSEGSQAKKIENKILEAERRVLIMKKPRPAASIGHFNP